MMSFIAALAVALAPGETPSAAPKPSRTPLGDAVGVVTAVSETDVSVKFQGVLAVPGRSSSGSSSSRSRKGPKKPPSVKLKAIEETVTYRLPPDLAVSRLGSSDKLTAADVKVGDEVRVHVVRETTRANGLRPDVALVATKLTLARASAIAPPTSKEAETPKGKKQ